MKTGASIYDPQFVKSVFDKCGPRYRIWSTLASFGFTHFWRIACVDALPPLVQGARGVDMMAGTGEVWPILLKRRAEVAHIFGIDISTAMHEEAVRRLHGAIAGRISFLEIDALKNELPSEQADFVISTFGMKTFDAGQHAIFARELARILKPGGGFSLIEASDPVGWWLRPLFRFHMEQVLPLVERLFLRGAQDFAMIGQYTRNFRDCSGLAELLRKQGLEVTFRRHFFGCATSVSGRKPA